MTVFYLIAKADLTKEVQLTLEIFLSSSLSVDIPLSFSLAQASLSLCNYKCVFISPVEVPLPLKYPRRCADSGKREKEKGLLRYS